jgi:CBS-domain-containing membrane protein
MFVKDCMKTDVASIEMRATLAEATKIMVDRHIGTLPVVDETGKLVGLLQMRDLHALIMPAFIRLVEDFDFVHDFGAVSHRLPDPARLHHMVKSVMQAPVSVEESCGLVRASALLHKHRVLDLPVVDGEGHLVGIASRVDIGTAIMEEWDLPT